MFATSNMQCVNDFFLIKERKFVLSSHVLSMQRAGYDDTGILNIATLNAFSY